MTPAENNKQLPNKHNDVRWRPDGSFFEASYSDVKQQQTNKWKETAAAHGFWM